MSRLLALELLQKVFLRAKLSYLVSGLHATAASSRILMLLTKPAAIGKKLAMSKSSTTTQPNLGGAPTTL